MLDPVAKLRKVDRDMKQRVALTHVDSVSCETVNVTVNYYEAPDK